MAEVRHYLELILGHRSERVVEVIGTTVRFTGISITAQIGQHNAVVLSRPAISCQVKCVSG
jgi:hypothetical protein